MLRTKRLILREPRSEDLAATHAIYSDPRAMRYWSTPPHDDISLTRELLNGRLAHWARSPTNFQIEYEGQLIGNAGNFAGTEIGYMIAPDHWRKGFMREALGAIIPHLWTITDHAELTADIDPRNTASIELLTSFGFVETHRAERTFYIDGGWADSIYFALKRPPNAQPAPQ